MSPKDKIPPETTITIAIVIGAIVGALVAINWSCGAAGKRVARSVRIEAGYGDGQLGGDDRRSLDVDSSWLAISVAPFEAWEPDPLQVVLVNAPPTTGAQEAPDSARCAEAPGDAALPGGAGPLSLPPIDMPQKPKEPIVPILHALVLAVLTGLLGVWKSEAIKKYARTAWSRVGAGMASKKAKK